MLIPPAGLLRSPDNNSTHASFNGRRRRRADCIAVRSGAAVAFISVLSILARSNVSVRGLRHSLCPAARQRPSRAPGTWAIANTKFRESSCSNLKKTCPMSPKHQRLLLNEFQTRFHPLPHVHPLALHPVIAEEAVCLSALTSSLCCVLKLKREGCITAAAAAPLSVSADAEADIGPPIFCLFCQSLSQSPSAASKN